MTTYFATCETLEELKKEYHRLARLYHSDNGGNDEIMKAINAEHDKRFNELKNTHRKKDGTTWTAEEGSAAATTETPEQFRAMVEELLKYDVYIEFIGCYVWVSGDTKPVKEQLKALGFRWAKEKQCWYLKPENYKPHNHKPWTMDEIRAHHGVQASFRGHYSEDVKNEFQPAPVF